MKLKEIMINDDQLMDHSNWLNVFRSFPQLVESKESFKMEDKIIYGGRIEGRGATINMEGTYNVPIGQAGYLYINIKTETGKKAIVSDILFSSTLPINDESDFDYLQTHIDAGERPEEVIVVNQLNIVLYQIDENGNVVEDYRNRDLRETLYSHWIWGTFPETGEKMNLQDIFQSFENKFVDLTSANQSILKLADVGIVDSDFEGMIFDQAIDFIAKKQDGPALYMDVLESVRWPNLTKAIGDKHHGEQNVSFRYFLTAIDYPSTLEIMPNGTDLCYRYKTDNYVVPILKYGDFCRESLLNNTLSARNTGNYINKLKETTSTMKIGFFGDSLTRGYDVTSPERESITYTDDNGDSLTSEVVRSYPEVLIDDFLNQIYPGRFTYENMGWSGGTAEDLYKRYWQPRDLDACLIMIGTNDESKNLAPNVYESYYSAFIERQLYYGVMPIIVGSISRMQKDRQQLNTYRMIAKKLAEKYNLYYVDGGDVSANMDNTLYSDFIHLNTNGYAYLGRVLSVPLIEDSVSGRQRIRSRDTILFNSADNIFVSDRPVGYSASFPTPTVTDTGGGSGLLLNPGQKCYIPFIAEEDALYIIPQVFFNTVEDEITLHIGEEGKVPQAKNAYYEINIDLLSEDVARYGRWRKTTTESMKNYRAYNVFNMIGAIETGADTDSFVMCGQKGEQLLVIENTSATQLIRVHLLEFLSEKEYLMATKKSGTRFYKDGTSADPLISILED